MTELEFGTVRQVNPIHASGTQNRAFRIPDRKSSDDSGFSRVGLGSHEFRIQ